LEIFQQPTVPEAAKNTSATKDFELVAEMLRKDRKATAKFVALYSDVIYRYVWLRLSPRADLVDDLVQEVFLAAWEHLQSYRGSSSLQGWLLGIARHKVEDYYRSVLRGAESLTDVDPEGLLAEAELGIEASLDRKRLQDKTQRVLENLPQAYRVVLLWRYWEKRSAREMAAQTGRTEKAIERLLARARGQFRERWNHA